MNDALMTVLGVLGSAAVWATIRAWIAWRGKIALRQIDAANMAAEREHEREDTGQHHVAETAQQWRQLYLDERAKRERDAQRYEQVLADIANKAKRASDKPPAHPERDTSPEPSRRRS